MLKSTACDTSVGGAPQGHSNLGRSKRVVFDIKHGLDVLTTLHIYLNGTLTLQQSGH
jgi:hypothetical protein